jgi:hypothetical protein
MLDINFIMNWGSLFAALTGLRAECPTNRGFFLGRAKRLLFPPKCPVPLWGPLSLSFNTYRELLIGP